MDLKAEAVTPFLKMDEFDFRKRKNVEQDSPTEMMNAIVREIRNRLVLQMNGDGMDNIIDLCCGEMMRVEAIAKIENINLHQFIHLNMHSYRDNLTDNLIVKYSRSMLTHEEVTLNECFCIAFACFLNNLMLDSNDVRRFKLLLLGVEVQIENIMKINIMDKNYEKMRVDMYWCELIYDIFKLPRCSALQEAKQLLETKNINF